MNYDPGKSEQLSRAFLLIEQASRDERYDLYANERSVLTIAGIDPDTRLSSNFKEVVDTYDWPSHMEDGDIEPIFEYGSVEEFVEALRGDGEPYLNNLNAIFRSTPSDEFKLENRYGVNPALHRAYALAPDLFEGIRELFSSFSQVQGNEQLTDVLRTEEMISMQVFKAFRILGRLVKKDDTARELYAVDPTLVSSAQEIVSAQDFLTT